jgi:hypothetical protein
MRLRIQQPIWGYLVWRRLGGCSLVWPKLHHQPGRLCRSLSGYDAHPLRAAALLQAVYQQGLCKYSFPGFCVPQPTQSTRPVVPLRWDHATHKIITENILGTKSVCCHTLI